MIKSISLATLLALLVAFLGFQYYITSVPDLAEPISVEEARFIERDNSLLVTLRGNDGRHFTLGLRGDIENEPEETALFFISNPDLVPYVYWPGLRSNDEKRVLELIEDVLEKEPEVEALPEIYEVLKNRN
ncbi:hypothetical protein [uncultured Marinobacter sp.]|uniref:hypothetical protein n=1 Tax=uncultured Marinobacter sp. TaxID=187379 RepID=UPI0025DED0B6|nr:hypothetical protein [uncultured Marinobacter sp.]